MEGILVLVSRVTRPGVLSDESPVTVRTDDRGMYRAFGLAPGKYVLSARAAQWEDGPRPAGAYYRDTSDPSRAEEIRVAAESEIRGVDMVLRPAPVFRISGKVILSDPLEVRHVRVIAAAEI